MSEALEIAKRLARKFEGFRSRPYYCSAGIVTIGFGTTRYPDGRTVKPTDPPASIEQGERYLAHEMGKCLAGTMRYCPALLTENDGKAAAIADYCYNLGIGRLQCSTLRRRINQRNWPEVIKELNKWVYGGGRKLQGLVLRRAAEARYFTDHLSNPLIFLPLEYLKKEGE